jgi:Ca2+-dependent lipid-binding protein
MLQKASREVIRLYMVEAFDLSSRDNGSDSDPYLRITCNGKTVSDRENYQIDEPNPKFYKKYDFEGLFPGTSPVIIECMDYDAVFGDELIGQSILDVEDRYFNLEWVNLDDKPIEYR